MGVRSILKIALSSKGSQGSEERVVTLIKSYNLSGVEWYHKICFQHSLVFVEFWTNYLRSFSVLYFDIQYNESKNMVGHHRLGL